MLHDYHHTVDEGLLRQQAKDGHITEAFGLLAEPLHEALYEAQDFGLLDKLSPVERLILSFDYVQTQVGQGGFIQLAQNGYTPLLVTVIETLQELNIEEEFSMLLDNVLKVIVLNADTLLKEASVEEFGKLYDEFREFEKLEEQFVVQRDRVLQTILALVSDGV